MNPGRPIKYGATTVLRFEIPPTWDCLAITGLSVSVKNSSGTEFDSGAAELYAGTTLNGATTAEATTVTIASDSDPMATGDRIRIGSASEIGEVREVLSYNSTSKVATIAPELEFAHATGADVVGMFATYELDLSDTATFTKNLDLWVHWTPDTEDLAAVEQFVIGISQYAPGDLWEEFETLYPTEYAEIQGRDMLRFERIVASTLALELRRKDMNIDKVQDMELLRGGTLRLARMLALEGSGDQSEVEYNRARESFYAWVDAISKLTIWIDDNQNSTVDEYEAVRHSSFQERRRFF